VICSVNTSVVILESTFASMGPCGKGSGLERVSTSVGRTLGGYAVRAKDVSKYYLDVAPYAASTLLLQFRNARRLYAADAIQVA